MSGHSKWNNIKNKKGVTDAKKGKAFGEIGRHIRMAVKEGGSGDPAFNPALRLALEKAREVNMPKLILIERLKGVWARPQEVKLLMK